MRIDLTTIDALTNALNQNLDGLNKVNDFSLGAAMELAVWAHKSSAPPPTIEHWCWSNAWLAESLRLLRGGHPIEPSIPYERVVQAIRPIRSGESLGADWEFFLQRFTAALKAAGFTAGWHQGIPEVFHEMADNVVQHSTLASKSPMNGIAGYSVTERRMSFTVADTGVGALETLKDNPDYAGLSNGRQALEMIAKDKASRRVNQSVGNGYNTLFTQLAFMNGQIRLRSADGVFVMRGEFERCAPQSWSLHSIPGFYISVECEI